MKNKGITIPGYQRGGPVSKVGNTLTFVPNTNSQFPSALPQNHGVYRPMNGMMMEMGGGFGYLGDISSYAPVAHYGNGGQYNPGYQNVYNPSQYATGGIAPINDIGGQHFGKPGMYWTNEGWKHSTGSTMNGASFSEYGGFMPHMNEVALVENGGHYPFTGATGGMIDKYNTGGYREDGGFADDDGDVDVMKKGGWIQGAVNPAHKGYCTPMTKSTCTPRRKAFAETMKKHHGFHKKQYGGLQKFVNGGSPDDLTTDPITGAPLPSTGNSSMPTSVGTQDMTPVPWRAGMTDTQAQQNVNYGAGSTNAYDPYTGNTDNGPGSNNAMTQNRRNNNAMSLGNSFNNLLGTGLAAASYFEDRRNQRNMQGYQRQQGQSSNVFPTIQGNRGDYTQQGTFRPDQQTPTSAGYFPQYHATGGYVNGQEVELHEHEIQDLIRKGYKVQYI